MVAGCLAVILTHWSAFGWKALSVPTGSMRPGMPPGSLALMHRVPDSSLKVGDVITYASPLNQRITISHRIIKISRLENGAPEFITKGDSNPAPDRPVNEGLVLGQVVWHIKFIGAWLMWSKTWLGITALVYLPAALIIIEEILRLNNYYKQCQPYKLFGYRRYEILRPTTTSTPKLTVGLSVFAVVMFASGIVGPKVEALLSSNAVTLGPNTVVTAKKKPGGGNQCSGNTNNNNNVNINNSTTQSASSGSATVGGNTTGGNAASGSAGNTNSTTVTINITNC